MRAAEQALAQAIVRGLTPKWTKYIKIEPHVKQLLFLCLDNVEEIFFGGAAGPGKSVALLAASLQYVDCRDYAALLVRKNYPDLSQPGGLIDISHEWLDNTDAVWNEQNRRWKFPSGAVLQFGHMDNEKEMRRYKGGEYQFVGIDEATDFTSGEAIFLHSRVRRRKTSSIPLRYRLASNPGGIGHNWIKTRYIDYEGGDRVFVPATMDDNPHLDVDSYVRFLARLDPVTQARLRKGDWTVTDGGKFFDRSWIKQFIEHPPVIIAARVRGWDMAATVSEDSKETAGVLMSRTPHGLYVVEHVIHGKWHTFDRDREILNQARRDGDSVFVKIEEEGGSGGKAQNDYLVRSLAGYRVESVRATGDKFVRAGAFAAQAKAGNVALVRGPWNEDFLDQLHNADPDLDVKHQMLDMMDGASLAFTGLQQHGGHGYAVETEDGEEDRRAQAEMEEDDFERRPNQSIYEEELDAGRWRTWKWRN